MVTSAPSPRWDTAPHCPHNTVSDSFTVHCYTQPQGLPSTPPHGHTLAGGRYTTTSTPQHNPVSQVHTQPSQHHPDQTQQGADAKPSHSNSRART